MKTFGLAILLSLIGCRASTEHVAYSPSASVAAVDGEPPNLSVIAAAAAGLGSGLGLDGEQLLAVLEELDAFRSWSGASAAEPFLQSQLISVAQAGNALPRQRELFLIVSCEALSCTPTGRVWVLDRIRSPSCPDSLRVAGALALADSPQCALPGELGCMLSACGGANAPFYALSVARVESGARALANEATPAGRAQLLTRLAASWLFSPPIVREARIAPALDITANPEIRWLRTMVDNVGAAEIFAAVAELRSPVHSAISEADFAREDYEFREGLVQELFGDLAATNWRSSVGPRPTASWD